MFKKIISGAVAGTLIVSSASVLAMSTNEFDNGIQKGLSILAKGCIMRREMNFSGFATTTGVR